MRKIRLVFLLCLQINLCYEKRTNDVRQEINTFEIFNRTDPIIFLNKAPPPLQDSVPVGEENRVEEAAVTLGLYLRRVAERELAVASLQSILAAAPNIPAPPINITETAEEVAADVTASLAEYSEFLVASRTALEAEEGAGQRTGRKADCCQPGTRPGSWCGPAANLTASLPGSGSGPAGLVGRFLVTEAGQEAVQMTLQQTRQTGCGSGRRWEQELLHTWQPSSKTVVVVWDGSAVAGVAASRLLASLSNTDRAALLPAGCPAPEPALLSPPVRRDLTGRLAAGGAGKVESDLQAAYIMLAGRKGTGPDSHAQVMLVLGRPDSAPLVPALPTLRAAVPGSVSLSVVMAGDKVREDDPLTALVAAGSSLPGRVFSLAKPDAPLGHWYTAAPQAPASVPVLGSPALDRLKRGASVALTVASPATGLVLGLEISLNHLLAGVYWAEAQQWGRVFLLDGAGAVLGHPVLQLERVGLEAGSLEAVLARPRVMAQLLDSPAGKITVKGISLAWSAVAGSPWRVVVARESSDRPGLLGRVPPPLPPGFHFSNLVLQTGRLCRHAGLPATLEMASLSLTPAAFSRPAAHLQPPAPRPALDLMAFLTDPTRLIANPGLRPGLRDPLLALASLTAPWRQLAFSSPLNNYLVARRGQTPQGAQLSYPGQEVVGAGLEPWYRDAAAQPTLLAVSPPRLDPGGAGWVVTLSTAVTGPDSSLAAVLAADFTAEFLGKVVEDSVAGGLCSTEGLRCFLVENAGYLVWHPQLELSGPRPRSHLTHLEPRLATELLQDGVLTKAECRDSEDRLQRVFQLGGEERVVVAGAGCTRHTLARVAGTALWLGVTNTTCSPGPAFCWCSTTDRSCLDCAHLSQAECECPCECGVRPSICSSSRLPVPACPLSYPSPAHNRYSTVSADSLPPCIQTECGGRGKEGCRGVLGCSWCHTASESGPPLEAPYCAPQPRCYGGQLGQASPYSRYSETALTPAPPHRPLYRASPIGPVAGGILAFFLLLALTGWGYRHWARGGAGRSAALVAGLGETGWEEVGQDGPGAVPPSQPSQPRQRPASAVVSPYRMNPGYRRPRPPPGTESDPGYSTMTGGAGEGDSAVELGGLRRLAGTTSGSSRASSPAQPVVPQQDGEADTLLLPGMTTLPNRLVVAATVHMVDT